MICLLRNLIQCEDNLAISVGLLKTSMCTCICTILCNSVGNRYCLNNVVVLCYRFQSVMRHFLWKGLGGWGCSKGLCLISAYRGQEEH